MVQLRTTIKEKWGQQNIIPYAGLVKISDIGCIEVDSQEIAELIQGSVEDFFIVFNEEAPTQETTDSIAPQTETNELQKTEKDELGDSEKEKDENSLSAETVTLTESDEPTGQVELIPELEAEKKELHEALDAMTLAQLKEYARNFPSAEWRTLNKEQLLNFLKSKI